MNMFRAFMELDEAYNERQFYIDEIKKAGKNYNFDKYTDAQLYRMWQRLQKPTKVVKEPTHELDLDFEPEKEFDCCECGMRLTDFGECPKCDLGEEDLDEGIFDKPTMNNWVSASGKPVSTKTANTVATSAQTSTAPSNGKYVVRIVSHGGRLRALATDGVHPAAWVAFPNDLRQFEGQQYEVDQLIWNGKNYRVAGNIVEI
jgi:hypothetical protein